MAQWVDWPAVRPGGRFSDARQLPEACLRAAQQTLGGAAPRTAAERLGKTGSQGAALWGAGDLPPPLPVQPWTSLCQLKHR